MIQMQYRESSIEQKPWNIYGESTRITKDMKKFSRELATNEFRFYEVRYVNTKLNPELKI